MGRQPRPRQPRPEHRPGSNVNAATSRQRSLNEWVLLALLAEEPAHGFSLAKALAADGDLGRILTVRRPLVYRALDRLAEDGLVESQQTEPGDSGPNRTVYRPTRTGRAALDRWLLTPVTHVRELRVEFLMKLRLLERRRRSPRRLIAAQRSALDQTLQRLIGRPTERVGADSDSGADSDADSDVVSGPADVVDLWRAHNARAVTRFLDELQSPG